MTELYFRYLGYLTSIVYALVLDRCIASMLHFKNPLIRIPMIGVGVYAVHFAVVYPLGLIWINLNSLFLFTMYETRKRIRKRRKELLLTDTANDERKNENE